MSAVWISEFHFCDLALPSNKDQIGQNKTTNWQISTISTQFLYSTGVWLSPQNSQWLDFWQLLDWWFSSVSTGASAFLWQEPKGQTPNAFRKPSSIQSGHCKLCVGRFSHIFNDNTIFRRRRLRRVHRGADRGAGDNQRWQLVAISAQINSFKTTSEKAKFLIDTKYESDAVLGPLSLLAAFVLGTLYFVVQVWRKNENRNREWPY